MAHVAWAAYDVPMGHKRAHQVIALVAAYAVALQAFAFAFAILLPAVAAYAPVICQSATADTGAPAQPALHTPCISCLAGHCAATIDCDRAAHGVRWQVSSCHHAAMPLRDARPATSPHSRHFARAPPAA